VLDAPEQAGELLANTDSLTTFVAHARNLQTAYSELIEERDDLQLLNDATMEHSNDIEEQLARKVDEVEALCRGLEVRNGFIREVFGRYMTEEVVETLLESPGALKLGGEKRRVTILMSDLRGFSALCERLTPQQVVATLNTYLGAMADIISSHHGTINEFIGDAILAVFGAPLSHDDNAQRAVTCAIAMQLAMGDVNRALEELGLPTLEMGIGIHTGEVVVGSIGSKKRAKYGLVGSPINLTSRIESYTVGGQVLISESTAQEIGDPLEVGNTFHVTPKGIKRQIAIHEVLGISSGSKVLRLATYNPQLHVLTQELAITVFVIDGKDVGTTGLTATIIRLGDNCAELGGLDPLPALTNLKLNLVGTDVAAEDLYAKVLRYESQTTVMVRFTSIPPAAGERLATLVPS